MRKLVVRQSFQFSRETLVDRPVIHILAPVHKLRLTRTALLAIHNWDVFEQGPVSLISFRYQILRPNYITQFALAIQRFQLDGLC